MRKLLFFICLVSIPCFADGPQYQQKDVISQLEFENVYQDLRGTRNPYISWSNSDIFNSTNPHVFIGGPPLTGALLAQPSEILTVYGTGGYPSSTYVDILSLNTGVWGARVGAYAYGGTGGANAVAAFIGATGNVNPTFGWGGGPAFIHSPFIDFQSANAGIFSSGGPLYFHQTTAGATTYFVKSNGHFDADIENGDLRLYPNDGVTGVNGNILIHAQSTPASDAVMKIQNAPLALSRTYTIPEAGQNATFIMSESTNTIGIHARVSVSSQFAAVGTPTNDDTGDTYIGYSSSCFIPSTSARSSTGNGQYFDICSIYLLPGDWWVAGNVAMTASGATVSAASGSYGTASGNSSTGISAGKNLTWMAPPTAAYDISAPIPPVRQSLSSGTTFYLKCNMSYAAGTPKAYGSLVGFKPR